MISILIILYNGSIGKSSSQSLVSDQEAQILVELLETYLGKMGGHRTIRTHVVLLLLTLMCKPLWQSIAHMIRL